MVGPQAASDFVADTGKKQMYGENLTCDNEHPKLHSGPIEDEHNVHQRRAAIGLMRLEVNAQLVAEMTPNVCLNDESRMVTGDTVTVGTGWSVSG